MALAPLRLPKLQGRLPVVDGMGRPLDYFLRFFNIDFSGAIERNEAQQQQIILQLQAVQATQQEEIDRLNRVLAGTEEFSAVNVGGTIVAENSGLADNIVTTPKVLQGQITPYFIAATAGDILWTAESAQKTVQTVSGVTVTRGAVKIDALITTEFNTITALATVGEFRLYRDATEIVFATAQLRPGGEVGGNFIHPRQWIISWVDSPAPGTYDYSITFQPGEVTDGAVRRRTLTALPLEG